MERALTKKEKLVLANADLTPKAERYISELWSKEQEPVESALWTNIVGNMIGLLLIPTLIFVLGSKVFNWALIPEGFENITFFFIWLVFVITLPTAHVIQYFVFDDTKITSIFSYKSLKILVKRNVLIRYYGRLAFLSLVGLIIFRGEIPTAVALVISWIVDLLMSAALQGKIRLALQKIK